MTIAVWRRDAWSRVRVAWQPIALAAIAAAIAWLVTDRVLGHPQAFFAPIAAAIALSTSPIQRARRTIQRVIDAIVGAIVASVLRAAGDDLARLLTRTHHDAGKRAWRTT